MFYIDKKFVPSKYKRNGYCQMGVTEYKDGRHASPSPREHNELNPSGSSLFLVPVQQALVIYTACDCIALFFWFPNKHPYSSCPAPSHSYYFALGVVRADDLSFDL